MYIDKLIRKEVITLIISVIMLVVIFIGVTFAKFLSVDNGEETVIEFGDLKINFCNDSTCDSTYSNIGQVIGTKVVDGVSMPASIYPFKNDGTYSNENPYIFKVENTGTLDSTVKIRLKEDASFTPTGDYSDYARLTSKYANHLKIAIRKRVLYQDTGYQLGDINMDGIVNKKDLDFITYCNANNISFSELQQQLGDLNSDSSVDAIDATIILRMLAGKKTIDGIIQTYTYSYTDLEDGVIFKDDIIKAGESATYFLWLYLDETTPNDAQKTFFVGNIDVEGEFIPKVNPVSFNDDSWDTIISAVKAGNTDKYNVGDTKEVDLGDYGTHTLRIANKSTPSECSNDGFSQTACGFVLEFADIITTHNMNATETNVGGWPGSSMYTFVNNDIYDSLPSELKNAIIDTTVVSGYGTTAVGTNFTSTDKLYLLSTAEVWLNGAKYDKAIDVTRQLDYYKILGITTSNHAGAIKKNGTSNFEWWLRSGRSDYGKTTLFYAVDYAGTAQGFQANRVYGVSPAFRIG